MITVALLVIALGLVVYALSELTAARPHTWLPAATGTWRQVRIVLALLPLWVASALWETYPLYKHFTTAMPSGHDTSQYVWNLWWMKYALLTLHQYPFFTTYMFAPQQADLAFHTFTPLNDVLSIPLQLIWGLPVAFNTLLLAGFVASALGTFLLVRQETGSAAGAFAGSVAYPFAPYVIAHMNGGHFGAVNTWAVPFFAFFLLRWLRGVTKVAPHGMPDPQARGRAPVLRDAALAGLCLGCQGLDGLDQVAFAVSFGGVVVLASLLIPVWTASRDRHALSFPLRRWLAGLLMMSGVGLVVFLPEFVPFLIGLAHGWTTNTPLIAATDFSPDLAAYLLPLYLHPLWGKAITPLAITYHSLDQPKVVFLGYTALTLALLSLFRARLATVRHWWYMAVLFWLLSLGPYLHAFGVGTVTIVGKSFTVPLPYLLYRDIPLIGGGRIPAYASVITALCLAVLAGHGVAVLSARLHVPFAGAPLAALAACLVLFESLSTPIPLFFPQADAFYTVLAHDPGHMATLEEPLGWQDGRIKVGNIDRNQLYSATVSGKPSVTGYLGRVPDSFFSYYTRQTALAYFIDPSVPPTRQGEDSHLVLSALQKMDVGYIIVHRFIYYDQLISYIQGTLGLSPMYTDASLTAFRVPPAGLATTASR